MNRHNKVKLYNDTLETYKKNLVRLKYSEEFAMKVSLDMLKKRIGVMNDSISMQLPETQIKLVEN